MAVPTATTFMAVRQEVHFCATSFGWDEFLDTVNPFKILVVMVLNFWMVARVCGLMFIEVFLAIFDFLKGLLRGRKFSQELLMIPARVVVVVLMRELVTLGACYDSSRGLPVIHLNFLGFDEQAHRRGPGSKFAHWTLKAIDRSIKRIWNAAHRGAGREYDVWVYSDHGQESTRPYQLTTGKLIQQVVAETVDGGCQEPPSNSATGERRPTRARWLGIGWLVSMLFGEQDEDLQNRSTQVQTVTTGPLAFVYFLNEAARQRRSEWAAKWVQSDRVPLVVQPTVAGQAKVITVDGELTLPGDAVLVFGADHPFLADVTEDLIRLVHHPDAGDLVLSGWSPQAESTSFVLQNGSHGGPGVDETNGFALLPADAPIATNQPFLRPNDLRLASLNFLGREPNGRPTRQVLSRDRTVRILTYNVHACVGMDGQLSPERIARVIGQSGASIICLQELDVFRHRLRQPGSGARDRPAPGNGTSLSSGLEN